MQNRVTDAARQTVMTLLHAHDYLASLEAFPHNLSDVSKFIKSEYDMITKAKVRNKPDQEQPICRHQSALQQDQYFP